MRLKYGFIIPKYAIMLYISSMATMVRYPKLSPRQSDQKKDKSLYLMTMKVLLVRMKNLQKKI